MCKQVKRLSCFETNTLRHGTALDCPLAEINCNNPTESLRRIRRKLEFSAWINCKTLIDWIRQRANDPQNLHAPHTALSLILRVQRFPASLTVVIDLSTTLYGAENWTLHKLDQIYLEGFETWCWRRMEKISLTDRMWNEVSQSQKAKKHPTFNDKKEG